MNKDDKKQNQFGNKSPHTKDRAKENGSTKAKITSQAVADLQKTLDSLKTLNKFKSPKDDIKQEQAENKESNPVVNKPLKQEQEANKPSAENITAESKSKEQEVKAETKKQDAKAVTEAPKKKFNLLGKFADNKESKKDDSLKQQDSLANKEPSATKQESETTVKPNILFNKINKSETKEEGGEKEKEPTLENLENKEQEVKEQENTFVAESKDSQKEPKENDAITILEQEEPKNESGDTAKEVSSAPLANIFESAKQSDQGGELSTEGKEEGLNLKVKQTEDLHHDKNFIESISNSVKQEIEEFNHIVDKDGNVLAQETLKRNNSRYLKVALAKIIDMFQISIDQDVLFANIGESENGVINTAFLAEAGKRAEIRTEINRINLVDIKTNNCVLLLKNGKGLVIIDEDTLYDPEQDCYLEFNRREVSEHYIGYTLFFHNEEFSVTEFLKKSTLFSQYIKSNIPMFLEILVLSFLINMFVIITPFYTINIYDRVIPNNAIPTLIVLSTGMMLVYIFDFIFKTIRSYITDYVSSDIGNNVDKTLMERMLGAKSAGITMSHGGKINLFKELQSIREFYFSRFIPSLIDMPFVVLFFLVLFIISPIMSLVPLFGVIVIFVVNILFQVPLQSSYGNIVKTDQNRIAFLTETVHSVDTLKLFNGSGKRLTGWTRSLADYYKSSFKYSFTINTAAHLSLMIMNLLTIAILIVGVVEIKNLAITIGGLIAANTLATRIVTPMVTFSGLVVRYRSIQQTLLYVQKFMDQPAEDHGLNNASKKGPFKGGLQFDRVSFIYPGNKLPILNKCSFDIKPKEKVGIIGRTGAGKSTITRLVTGLDFANDGLIKVDGIEIDNINIVELRKSIGFLPQKSQFFQASIRDNILLSSKNVTKEQYDRACALSGVDMLKELSGKGDDMLILEGGANLSGGQQQIIGLARAIINDPPIIIMDEPTNGMDTSLEAKFMENVAKYVKDKTFILITHRATQLSLVDRLILLERGNVVIDDEKSKVLEKLNKSKK